MKILISLLFIAVLLTPQLAFAHVLKTSNSVGAVLHMDPNDSPVTKQPTYFYLEFKDKEGTFNLESCSCTVTLSKDSKTTYSQSLANPYFDYTFDQPGVYQLEVTGKPSLRLNYDIRVTPSSDTSWFEQLKVAILSKIATIFKNLK